MINDLCILLKMMPIGKSIEFDHDDKLMWSVTVRDRKTGKYDVLEQSLRDFSHPDFNKKYAVVTCKWFDDPESRFTVIIKLSGEIEKIEEDDDRIFFYADSLNDFKSLFEEGVNDFVILEVEEYTDNLTDR